MLKQIINDKGILFVANYNGHDLHFEEWQATDDCIYYLPLATLVDNGYAHGSREGCFLPFENVYLLDEDERILLDLPPLYDKAMRLVGMSTLNQSDFVYQVEFLTHVPDGELLAYERCANILTRGHERYLLSEPQYAMVRKVDAYNATPEEEKTTDYNLRHFAEIKDLAIKAGCQLDSYLKNENVYAPQHIKIELGEDEEGFTIEPAIDTDENGKFQEYFDKMRKVQGQYPVQRKDGERVRIVLSEEQKEGLKHLKGQHGKHKSKEEAQKMAQQPTAYFDPDLFDLSDFYSDRVLEIGLCKPNFRPILSPFKSVWFAGAIIDTPQDGTAIIKIRDEVELNELKQAILVAQQNHNRLVAYGYTLINIDDAIFLAKVAAEQLTHPTIPTQISGMRGLVIEQNLQNLGYEAQEADMGENHKYTLYTNPFLREEFPLKEHQKEGIAWLQNLCKSQASGCLLADDMGLGKTLQVLYFIDWHSRTYHDHKPYLIVVPLSLLENWKNEYEKFFRQPHMKVNILKSKDVTQKFDREIVERMQKMDIILTTYDSLRLAQLNFCAVEFDVAVFDEAQRIKTQGTLVTNAAKAVNSHFKIAMTGTPVENSLRELWCIMDLCVPGLLGSAKSFAAKFRMSHDDPDFVDLGNKVHKQLGKYFMRRLKKDVMNELPKKTVVKEKVTMPLIQQKAYAAAATDTDNMLVAIMQIREVSDHPFLFDRTIMHRDFKEVIEASARMQATLKFLDEIKAKNEKAIIFAGRKKIQKMLQVMCLQRYGLVCKIINGDTPAIVEKSVTNELSRQGCIDEFQKTEGFNVIIMSPLSVGLGLNVTAANHVIHYSRHWNPAKENQATDRAYRIGQTRDVTVYYPMAVIPGAHTFDETLDDLITRKAKLADATIFPTESLKIKAEDIGKALFGDKDADEGAPQNQ